MNKKILIILLLLMNTSAGIAIGAANFFPTFADSHTVALWLFDETDYNYTTLLDASEGAYDLRLMPGGHLRSGKFGNCLSLSGGAGHAIAYAGFAGKVVNEHIREPDGIISGLWGPTEGPEALLTALAGNEWTCEFWLQLKGVTDNATIIDLGWAYAPGFTVRMTGAGHFEVIADYSGFKATCPVDSAKLTDRMWHHVAFTRSGSAVRCFVDGHEQGGVKVTSISKQSTPGLQKTRDHEHEHRGFGEMSEEERRLNRFNLTIGHRRLGGNLMRGMVDELRFSEVVRYAENSPIPGSFARKFGAWGAKPSEPALPNGPPLLFTLDADSQKPPLQFGLRKYVFIDNAIVETSSGLRLTMNPPINKQAIDFAPDKSAWRPSVLDKDGKIYMFVPEGYNANLGLTFLLTSADGLHFTEHPESPVIAGTPLYGTFFEDSNPNVPAEERFKLTAWVGNRGICLFFSPDSVHWRRNETLMLPLVSGGGAETYYDDQRGRYVTFIKRDASFRTPLHPGGGRRGIMFETAEPLKTWPFIRLENPYFEGWTLPAVTGEGPNIIGVTSSGEAYRTRAIKYPWAPDVYLAFVWRYQRQLGEDPPRHVGLGVSRDSRHWAFFEPTQGWYLPTEGDPDPEQLSISGLIRRGDKIWQYTNHGGPHGGSAPRTYYRWTQRLDGFVSLDGTGTVITKPLVFNGEGVKLTLNSAGSTKVAILDEDKNEMSGFGISDCDPITDSVTHVVSWSGNTDLTVFSGKTIRLKFVLSKGKLYAFEFSDDE